MIVIPAEWWTDLLLNTRRIRLCIVFGKQPVEVQHRNKTVNLLHQERRTATITALLNLSDKWEEEYNIFCFSSLLVATTSTLRPRPGGGRTCSASDIATLPATLILFDFSRKRSSVILQMEELVATGENQCHLGCISHWCSAVTYCWAVSH